MVDSKLCFVLQLQLSLPSPNKYFEKKKKWSGSGLRLGKGSLQVPLEKITPLLTGYINIRIYSIICLGQLDFKYPWCRIWWLLLLTMGRYFATIITVQGKYY